MPRFEEGFLCSDCYSRLRLIENYCPRCAAEVNQFADTRDGCQRCRGQRLSFDGAASAARYDGITRDILLRFKSGKNRIAGIPLANLLIDSLRNASFIQDITTAVSVPLSRKSLSERGFNQAEFLARRVAKAFQLPLRSSNLVKVKETAPQAQLTPTERRSNVKGAFTVKRPREFSDKTVLLIDDVMTTGATLSECAHALKKAGAREVYAAIVLRLRV
jgi:ComF family protein